MKPTAEQQAVISAPLAPLRVAAAAGTGKTSTMALRLAALIEAHGLDPEMCLGITFTNKAAEQLTRKLQETLPEHTADGRIVEVGTYHGFAFGLLREFGAYVGVERNVRVITPGFARQLMRLAIAGGAGYTHLDLTYMPGVLAAIATLDAEAGEHLVDLDDPGLVADPETGPARRELLEIIDRYRAEKLRLDVVDYTDLLRLAVTLLERHPDVAARVRSRYSAVLLDEYQDTSPAQRRMLQLVFGDGFPVTAVGDSDQTIYEWRGASPENFDAFPTDFPTADDVPAATLELGINWRSDERIVDVANDVREELGSRSPVERLVPAPTAGAGRVETARFGTWWREADWIADRIKRLVDEDDTPLSDIAILVRKNASIPTLLEALEAQDLPVEVVSVGGLLSIPEVADLHAWLTILARPDAAPHLVRVLHRTRYRLGLGDLAVLARWVAGDRNRLLIDAVEAPEAVEGLRPEAAAAVDEFAGHYRHLLELAQGVTLVELCRRILHTLGYWIEVESLPDTARLTARLNLYRFLDVAQEWSPLEGRPSLDAFLDYLEMLRDDRSSDDLDTARLSGKEAVTISTVHRAKGLQWPVVVLPHLADKTFPSTPVGGYPDPTRFPGRVPFSLRLDAARFADSEPGPFLRAAHHDQEWRTAYVAVTRAKHLLVATTAGWYPNLTKVKQPSPLFEAIASHGEVVVEEEIPAEAPAPPADPGDAVAPDPLFSDGWKAAVMEAAGDPSTVDVDEPQYDAMVKQMRLEIEGLDRRSDETAGGAPLTTSVTGLVTYASCPQRFYWSEVDRLPRRPAEWLKRGTDLHRRIELHNRGRVPFEDAGDGTYDMGPADTEEPAAGAFDAFAASRFGTSRPALVETAFSLLLDDAIVRGRIDAVYADDGFEVVDYKSGKPSADPARRVQLQAYALAAEDGGLGIEPPDEFPVTFAYFGGGTVAEETELADAAWRSEARSDLRGLVAGIAGGRFEPAPSDACRRCDFLAFCDAGKRHVDAS